MLELVRKGDDNTCPGDYSHTESFGGDLEDVWIIFDHVKRVKHWTTMACHVYDSVYCRVMTIAVCDMQSEDAAA